MQILGIYNNCDSQV